MENELKERFARIHAAMGDVTGLNLAVAPPYVFQNERRRGVFQDWSGGRSQAHMEKDANSVIAEFMGLRDRAEQWLRANGHRTVDVRAFMRAHRAVALIWDLGNTDKHGRLDHKPYSGFKPRLVNVKRVAQLKTQAKKGSWVQYQMGPGGQPIISGDGTASLVLTGDVLDENGQKLGELHSIIEQALSEWEAFLGANGLS